MAAWLVLGYLSAYVIHCNSLGNGLALTPPMGWLSWQRFRCETDCVTYPGDCINAKLYMDMADRLANDGWLEVGYNQVNIDDCWSLKARDNTTNEQVADPNRFPNGIKGVADYVHKLGLKLGLYNDIGSKTCGGYTGIDGNYQLDAQTFASWDIDMIKVDGCNAHVPDMWQMYPAFGEALNKTGRAIVYSCSWPAYIPGHAETIPPVDHTTLADIATYCNLWRNYKDIQDSWVSVQGIMQFWQRNYSNYSNDAFLHVAGPGNWNDPDMIIGGDNGLSLSEAESQFAIWAIIAAPLLMSNDLRNMDPKFKALLQNKEIIAINQDRLGKQGGCVYKNGNQVIWMRELADVKSIAVVLQNLDGSGFGTDMGFEVDLVPDFVFGWNTSTVFTVRNLLNHTDLGPHKAYFMDLIQPSSVGMYKMTIV